MRHLSNRAYLPVRTRRSVDRTDVPFWTNLAYLHQTGWAGVVQVAFAAPVQNGASWLASTVSAMT